MVIFAVRNAEIQIIFLITTYKISSNILPSVDEIIGDRQNVYRRNRSMTDKIFCICQIVQWGICHLFIEFKVQLRGKYCKVAILIEFGM
jgi:hypothetical protein